MTTVNLPLPRTADELDELRTTPQEQVAKYGTRLSRTQQQAQAAEEAS